MSCDPGAHGLSNVSKPKLRGHCLKSLHRMIFGVCVVGTISSILFHLLYISPRKRRYQEFRKNVDINKEEERISALGWFQSGGSKSGGISASEGDEPESEDS